MEDIATSSAQPPFAGDAQRLRRDVMPGHEMMFDDPYETPPGAKYFHTESTRGRHNYLPYGASANTPMSADTFYGSPSPQRALSPQAHAPSDANGAAQTAETNKTSKKVILYIVLALIIAGVVAVAIYFWHRSASAPAPAPSSSALAQQLSDNQDVAPATTRHSPLAQSFLRHTPAPVAQQSPYCLGSSDGAAQGVIIDSEEPLDEPNWSEDASTQYYYPSPLGTPPPVAEHEPRGSIYEQTKQALRNEWKNNEDDRKDKPPPSSWFGADAFTRGEAVADLNADQALQTHEAMNKIYEKKSTVLGGKNKPPYATVNAEAARNIGWASMDDEAEVARRAAREATSPSGDSPQRTTMHELYQQNLAGRRYESGSSASTIVSADQQAAVASSADPSPFMVEPQTLGYNPDLAEKSAIERERSRQISAEASAAIDNIYAKKRQAAAGLSAAASAQESAQNDVNFDYFNVNAANAHFQDTA